MRLLLTGLAGIFLLGCSADQLQQPTLFTNATQSSGITFRNDLKFTERLNPYTYRNFYNGAGVAVGDINNDGLLDIYFAGNQVDNKLYINEGNLVFKDITAKAGVACSGVWAAGVTFVDINGDGYLDIYVCKSGDPESPNRNNELFINNGDLTFTERSKEYGLDVTGLSVQAAFFDFDKDGDLDCYLLTNSFKAVGKNDLVKDQRNIPDKDDAGNKFFINENGKFRDYSAEAHIYRSNIGFGLGITLGDFNNDSWVDIFVSNDFFERDYLYINDQHGAFTESLTDYFESISMGSMGADFADLDNDGNAELFVTEMLPDSLNRKKTKTVYESWNKYQLNVQNGYYHQFSRNVLQKKTAKDKYVELGRMAGVSASEWSWGALLFDMNNDGKRDIFIANGIYKDLLDRDYLAYTADPDNMREIIRKERKNAIVKLIDLMPSSESPNYAFKNNGNLNFTNSTKEWGLDESMFSSGSAYGDLDNDGDLDLVVNNLNAPSVLYRNNTDTAKYKSITISAGSTGKNRFGVGAEIVVFCGTKKFVADNFVTRGFQSSVQPYVTIGLGEIVSRVDSIWITWPDKGYTMIYDIPVNKKLDILRENYPLHDRLPDSLVNEKKSLKLEVVTNTIFRHAASGLNDFNRDRLLPAMYSNESPAMLKGDIDGDKIEDIYVGGGKNQPGTFIQFKAGKFNARISKGIDAFSLGEETKGLLFDADNDGDVDLYMATGGRFFTKVSDAQKDRLFLNNGKGDFTESPNSLTFSNFFSTSVVKPVDFDKDGDLDLVVGERFDPLQYGTGGRAYLLQNNGRGIFKDVTGDNAPALQNAGMITDIEVQDFNNDGWNDIIFVGDWIPVTFLQNTNGSFADVSEKLGLKDTEGWWHEIESGDFNKDGRVDFVLGNHGLNSFFKPGDRMYVDDFDGNGSSEQIFCTAVAGKYYPIADKDELLSQLPSLRKTVLYYKDYGKKSIDELFPKGALDKARVFEVKRLSSSLLLSDKTGYRLVDLPGEAQYAPVYSLLVSDFDNDGVQDVIAGGNQYLVKPQFGRYDASSGWFFKGVLNKDQFSFEQGTDLNVKGQIRDIEYLKIDKTTYILFAKYEDDLEVYKISD